MDTLLLLASSTFEAIIMLHVIPVVACINLRDECKRYS